MRKGSAWSIIAAGLLWVLKQWYDWIVLGRLVHEGHEAELTDQLFIAVPLLMAFGIAGTYGHRSRIVSRYGRAGLLIAAFGNILFSLSLMAEAWFAGSGIGFFSLLAFPGLLLQVVGFMLFGWAALRKSGIDAAIGRASIAVGMLTAVWPLVTFITYNLHRDDYGKWLSTQYGFPIAIAWGCSWVILGYMLLRETSTRQESKPYRSSYSR